jgi:hypothetical protein
MKSILLTTTALVAFAGAAVADGHTGVSFTGTASLGYNNTDEDGTNVEVSIAGGANDGNETYTFNTEADGFTYGATLGLGYAAELDNGLTASASASVTVADDNDGEVLEAESFGIKFGSDTATFSYGNNITPGATQFGVGNRASAKDVYLGFNYADEMFAVGVTRDENEALSFGASATVSGFTVAAGMQQESALVSSADARRNLGQALLAAKAAAEALDSQDLEDAYWEDLLGADDYAEITDGIGIDEYLIARRAAIGRLTQAEADTIYESYFGEDDDAQDLQDATMARWAPGASTNNAMIGFKVTGAAAGADLSLGYSSNTTTGRSSIAVGAKYPMGDITVGGSYTMNTAGTEALQGFAFNEDGEAQDAATDADMFDGSNVYMFTAAYTAGAVTLNAGVGTAIEAGGWDRVSGDDSTADDIIAVAGQIDRDEDDNLTAFSLADNAMEYTRATAAATWSAGISYDMAPMVVSAGVEDSGSDFFAAVAYDLGGGAAATASYAVDNNDDNDAGDKIGGNALGASVGLTFKF